MVTGFLKKLMHRDNNSNGYFSKKRHFQDWKIKSKNQRYYFLAVPFSTFLIFSFLNYFYLTGFRYSFPPVDIVNILSRADELPAHSYDSIYDRRFRFDNSFLLEVLKDIYILRETEYLNQQDTMTITVEPQIIWNTEKISLILREGMFDFATGSVIREDIQVSQMISKAFGSNGNHFNLAFPSKFDDMAQHFIRRFLYTLFYFPSVSLDTYNIDTLIKPFHLTRVSNFGILVLAAISMASFVSLETFQTFKYILSFHTVNTGVFIVSAISCLSFLLMKLVLVSFIDIKFPNTKYHIMVFLSLLELILFFCVYIKYLLKFKERLRSLKEDFAIKQIMKRFTPSPENISNSSSIYPPSTTKTSEKNHDADIPNEENVFTIDSAVSLDPMRKDSAEADRLFSNLTIRRFPKTASVIMQQTKETTFSMENHTAPPFAMSKSDSDQAAKPQGVNPYSTPTSFIPPVLQNQNQKAASIFTEEDIQ